VNFVFQGFQSGLPTWIYLILFAGTVYLAWWSYRNVQSVSPVYRYGLITLRSLTFFILLILLINPFFKSEQQRYVRPEILVMFDNSSSVQLSKGIYEGNDSYREVINTLNFRDSSRTSFRFYSFGEQTNSSYPDSLSFDENETDLYSAIEVIKNRERETRAAVLISDGIFNKGRNPVFLASELNLPVFSIGVGDTTHLKDLVVRNVSAGATGYVNTSHPVEATVQTHGLEGSSFEIQLKSSGQVIDSKTVTVSEQNTSQRVSFSLDLVEEGLHQFEIFVPEAEGEFTDVNNSAPFSVEVLDDKQRILHLAFEIHPDVKTVRSILRGDENTQLSTLTWLKGTNFLNGPFAINPDTLDMAIIHGFPRQGVPGNISGPLSRLLDEVPVLFIATPLSEFQYLPVDTQILPVNNTPGMTGREISLSTSVDPTEHPVMELPDVAFNRLPPLYTPLRGSTPAPGTTVLFSGNYRGTPTGTPVIAVQQLGNRRTAVINAYGWYRMKQSTNAQARQFVEALVFNIISWTAAKPDNRRLKIQPEQKIFTGTDPVGFTAFLTNESGEVESDAVIELTISGEQVETRFYSMSNRGNGRYQLDIGSLPEGIYTFEATAKKGTRVIDSQQGEFSVSDSNIEFVDTIRNDKLLLQIAENSGGRYLPFPEAGSLWSIMNEMNLLDREEILETDLFYPYQHAFWFILVIIFLGAEWLLRKNAALP